jgi:ribulose-bisphosphate carboxylase large chain
MSRIYVHYRLSADAGSIAERAKAIAVEQSVEMPLSAIDDARVHSDIVGRVDDIRDLGDGSFAVRIGLATATTGGEPGQLFNMLFGNTSMLDGVEIVDVELPAGFAARFGGPNHGLDGLRARCGATTRAMTCSALKPQGLPPEGLAKLAGRMAQGGIDFIKDDHGLANQDYSPFARRVAACAASVRAANAATGGRTSYLPSLSGHFEQMRGQIALARNEGVDAVLVAPMVCGVATFHALTRAFPDVAFMTHPSFGGNARMAPPLLLGKLFRLLGSDATVFPNHGGRFGYTPATCRELAAAARDDWHGLKPCVPVPAGGMTRPRVGEMLDFYGADVMLLIGGGLLAAREELAAEARAFVGEVARRFAA